jgi:S1-C subfamily serine protease
MRSIYRRVSLSLALSFTLLAQDAVPIEILERTRLIRSGDTTGTGFDIDHHGKLYTVTARHVIDGMPVGKAKIQVWHSDRWAEIPIVKTLFPSSPKVDIAVLETTENAPQPFAIAVASKGEGSTMGQQVWFLGYPFGDTALTTRNHDQILPFIKRGTMSAIDASKPDAVIMYIDGFNNPGFSGGPIICWQFSDRVYRIIGVVKGYRPDTAKVMVNDKPVDTNILVNSGILVGYSITHAIEAIEADLKKSR